MSFTGFTRNCAFPLPLGRYGVDYNTFDESELRNVRVGRILLKADRANCLRWGGGIVTLWGMIRPFDLRDVALVHRLSEQGVSLHTESALTDNFHPLKSALFSMVGGDFPTFVWKGEQGDATGFIQVHLEGESQHAHIYYLGLTAERPSSAENHRQTEETGWLSLLDQAVVEVGRRGIHSLVAEVSETGTELPALRRAGFVVYTRQDIWVIQDVENKPHTKNLQPRQSSDDWDLQLLYDNTVPRLVQLVESLPPLNNGEGWVLHEEDDLTAFVHSRMGSAATWLRLFIHPNAETSADEIIATALQMTPKKAGQPIYCCVRRYQSWLQSHLERAGFEWWGSQAVMVKHTVQLPKKPITEFSAVLEAQGVSPTAPLIPRYQPTRRNGKVIAKHKT